MLMPFLSIYRTIPAGGPALPILQKLHLEMLLAASLDAFIQKHQICLSSLLFPCGRSCTKHPIICTTLRSVILDSFFVKSETTLMSLQALYAQNSRIYPFITQYLRNDTIIILTHCYPSQLASHHNYHIPSWQGTFD